MKEYVVSDRQDFDNFVKLVNQYFDLCKIGKHIFKPFVIMSKKYVRSKTPKQHKYYWFCIAEMQKAFKEMGYNYTKKTIHEFMKKEAGFSEVIELPNGSLHEVTMSIADDSKDVNVDVLKELIEFILKWTQENLNYTIPEPNNSSFYVD